MISWANIFLHFDNHNEWFHFLFSLQYFLKEMENIFSLVLQSYKLKYSSKFGWTRKSCPKIPLVFHQLSRSIENVDFFFHFLAIYCQWSENIFWIDHYSFEESWDIFLRKIFFSGVSSYKNFSICSIWLISWFAFHDFFSRFFLCGNFLGNFPHPTLENIMVHP